MKNVSGSVRIELWLNVYDLDTDSVSVDKYGQVRIEDEDKFFDDWVENWEQGIGELLGVAVHEQELTADKDEEE